MPFIFNEETNAFEGTNAFGTSLAGFDFSVFGGMITNSGAITTTVTANSDAGIELTAVTTMTASMRAAGMTQSMAATVTISSPVAQGRITLRAMPAMTVCPEMTAMMLSKVVPAMT